MCIHSGNHNRGICSDGRAVEARGNRMNSTEDRANAYTSERRTQTGQQTLTRVNSGNERTPGTSEWSVRWTSERRDRRAKAGDDREWQIDSLDKQEVVRDSTRKISPLYIHTRTHTTHTHTTHMRTHTALMQTGIVAKQYIVTIFPMTA
jgi:hypothetical protein